MNFIIKLEYDNIFLRKIWKGSQFVVVLRRNCHESTKNVSPTEALKKNKNLVRKLFNT